MLPSFHSQESATRKSPPLLSHTAANSAAKLAVAIGLGPTIADTLGNAHPRELEASMIPIVLSRSMLLKLKNTYIEMAFTLCFPLTHSSLRVIRLLRPGFGDGHYICSAPAVRHAAGKINQPEPPMIVITCFFTTVSISEVPNILRGIASYLLARMPEPGIRWHNRKLVIRLCTFQLAVYLSSEGVENFQTNSTSSIKTANLPT